MKLISRITSLCCKQKFNNSKNQNTNKYSEVKLNQERIWKTLLIPDLKCIYFLKKEEALKKNYINSYCSRPSYATR